MVTGGKVSESGLPTTGESPIADYMAAALLAFGVASALFRRERTGRGGRVDTSLLQSALALQNNLMIRVESVDGPRHADFREWLGRGPPRRRAVRRAGRADAAQPARGHGRRLLPHLRDQGRRSGRRLRQPVAAAEVHRRRRPRGSRARRRRGRGRRGRALRRAQAGRRGDDRRRARPRSGTTILAAAGVPASRVALPLEILDDAQPAANAMFARQEHPALGPLTVFGPPLRLDGGGFAAAPPTPAFGSEVRAILEWAGFAERDVDRLMAGGAVSPAHG